MKKNLMKALVADPTHSHTPRIPNDFYATDPKAVEMLLEMESFSERVWEPTCGMGHISKVLRRHGYIVRESDIADFGGNEMLDFLSPDNKDIWDGDIVINPPYTKFQEFAEKALSVVAEGRKVAVFMRLQHLEGKRRKPLYQNTPPIAFTSLQADWHARQWGTSA